MIENKFIELAQLYNCEYKVENFTVNGLIGSKLPVTIYSITINYSGIDIDVVFEFGNSNMAEFRFELKFGNRIPNFYLSTRDNFFRLFYERSRVWNISCKNEIFEKKIFKILTDSGLNRLANEEAFEPLIEGNFSNNVYVFSAKYYLGFYKKDESLELMLKFLFSMIDFFILNYS
ncbi:hypothetical protein [Flavobacterium okayamense]|uniref:DUF4304 domain-containing protein n=1 Tax=Flavobacterium okayamense TaxID=2830782 RepID=A0ABN6HZ21_9FLAO|nr:hypothetical protein [Flavobacterium okayamense]BCY29556.1 hypothetical protein KK2020170_24240 [Flavobacterium okayamense]